MRVSFVWWNTSLSPPRGKSASEDHKSYVTNKIDRLILEGQIHFMALGEVSEDDIAMIKERCHLGDHKIISGCVSAGRGSFDFCVIYSSLLFSPAGPHESIVSERGDRVLRVALKLPFFFSSESRLIHFFISHWPSRLQCDQNHPNRATLGLRLRDSVDSVFSDFGADAMVILLGDYNDEPFDHSIAHNLWSTRDRGLAKKKKKLLYNPFWRSLGHISAVDGINDLELLDGGTCFYHNDDVSRWKTFDQILISSTFLDGEEWRLNENLTRPLDIDGYSLKVVDRNDRFDHLPVIAVIERNFHD